MEIRPTFSDDRSEKLEHYGVKGMKWGKHLAKKAEEINYAVDDAKGYAHQTKNLGGRYLLKNVRFSVDRTSQNLKKATDTGRKKVERILKLKKNSKWNARLLRDHSRLNKTSPRVSDTAYVINEAVKQAKRY